MSSDNGKKFGGTEFNRIFSKNNVLYFCLGMFLYFLTSRLAVAMWASRPYGSAENIGKAIFMTMGIMFVAGNIYAVAVKNNVMSREEGNRYGGLMWIGFLLALALDCYGISPQP